MNAIQNAAVFLSSRHAVGGAAALSEHALENLARIDLHGQRRGVRPPRNRVHVDAAVVAIAGTDQTGVIFGCRVRWKAAACPGRSSAAAILIGRDTRVGIGTLSRFRTNAAEPRGRAQRMHRRGVGSLMSQTADDVHAIAERFERLEESERIRSPAPSVFGVHLIHDRAVRHVHETRAGDSQLAAARFARSARGTMESRNGSASVAPAPCRNVRRERCFFVMNMALS